MDFDQCDVIEDYYNNVTWFPQAEEIEKLSDKTNMSQQEVKVKCFVFSFLSVNCFEKGDSLFQIKVYNENSNL